jgi:hypothetical protein
MKLTLNSGSSQDKTNDEIDGMGNTYSENYRIMIFSLYREEYNDPLLFMCNSKYNLVYKVIMNKNKYTGWYYG